MLAARHDDDDDDDDTRVSLRKAAREFVEGMKKIKLLFIHKSLFWSSRLFSGV